MAAVFDHRTARINARREQSTLVMMRLEGRKQGYNGSQEDSWSAPREISTGH
jgi:hypothetical protein